MTSDRSRATDVVEWAFLVLVFSLAFMRPNVFVLGSVVVATDLAFIVCAVLFAVSLAIRRTSFEFDRIYIWLALYALALALSAAFSADPSRSLRRLPAELYLIALAVLTVKVVRDQRMLTRTLVVWLAASSIAAAVSTLTAVSFFTGWDNLLTTFALHHYGTLPPGNYPRIQGTFEYPSMLGNYLTVALLVLLAFWRSGRLGNALFAVLLIVTAVAIFFTLTPGIGGVVAAVGLWLYFITRGSKPSVVPKVAIAGVVAALAAFVLVSSLTPFGTAGPVYFSIAGYEITPTARLLVWQQAWATFVEHPVFGLGLGMPVVNLAYQVPAGGWTLITDAHNVVLNVAAQAGIAGAAALTALVIAVMRRSSFSIVDGDDPAALRLVMGVAFISCLVIQGFAGSFENARHLWVLIGLIVAADRITRTPQPTAGPRA